MLGAGGTNAGDDHATSYERAQLKTTRFIPVVVRER